LHFELIIQVIICIEFTLQYFVYLYHLDSPLQKWLNMCFIADVIQCIFTTQGNDNGEMLLNPVIVP
jgi:hypothetical protein